MIKNLLVRLLKSLTQGAFEATHSAELEAANARIKDLEGQVAALDAAKAQMLTAYNDLAARETAAQNDLQSLQVANRALQGQQAVLEAKIKETEDATRAKLEAIKQQSDDTALRSDL